MNFLHSSFNGGQEHVALVTLDAQANVMLLDDVSFHAYREGRPFSYHGGWATQSPVRLSPPHDGSWHVVIDMGDRSGTLKASVRILRRWAREG